MIVDLVEVDRTTNRLRGTTTTVVANEEAIATVISIETMDVLVDQHGWTTMDLPLLLLPTLQLGWMLLLQESCRSVQVMPSLEEERLRTIMEEEERKEELIRFKLGNNR